MLLYREKFLSPSENVWFQRMPILPPRKGWEIPGRGGDSQRSCMYVEMYEAYMLLEFLGGWGGGS